MEPTITIDNDSTPLAAGYTIRAHRQDRPGDTELEVDIYVLSRTDRTPYLVLVGSADDQHGWVQWRAYEVFGLLEPDRDDGVYVGPTSETPHAVIVEAATRRFFEDQSRQMAA